MDLITYWTIRLDWILVVWLFALGGVVGSFLNVVVYRLPAGKSIVHPGSCCPSCGHPIRWYHNLPIVSWLLLGGRCHDCRAKISPRYPLVELAAALLFVALFLADARPRITALADETRPDATISGLDILVRYAGDLWLLSTLLCAALIEFDRARVPRRIFAMAILVGLAAATISPMSRQSLPGPSPQGLHLGPAERGLAIAAAGLVAGWAIGHLIEVVLIRRLGGLRPDRSNADGGSAALVLASVGTLFGWAAAIAVGIGATAALVITRKSTRPNSTIARWGWSTFALAAAIAWIAAAHWLPAALPLAPEP